MLSEKQLEDLLFKKLDGEGLQGREFLGKRGLSIDFHSQYFRQFNLGTYGIADIVGFKYNHFPNKHGLKGYLDIQIIELKAVELTANDFTQLKRYKTGLTGLIKAFIESGKFPKGISCDISMILIGLKDKIDNEVYAFNYNDIESYSYNFSLEKGIEFKQISDVNDYWTKSEPDYDTKTIANVYPKLKNMIKHEISSYVTEVREHRAMMKAERMEN